MSKLSIEPGLTLMLIENIAQPDVEGGHVDPTKREGGKTSVIA